ncbi:MAG: SDR family NAD(P)-dependent oxidoreductase [bacterium]
MNNTAVITGAASGLGKALARHYAQKGWNIIVADINDEAGVKCVDELSEMGVVAFYQHCDVSKTGDFNALATFTQEKLGGCDLLSNNAGVASSGTLMDAEEQEWERLLTLDLMSCARGCKAFIPLLRETAKNKGSAAIINTASFAGIAQMPGMMTYNVAKAGVIALSETLRCELFADHIHVAAACPAFFKTNLVASMTSSDEATRQRVNKMMETSGVTAEMVANDIAKGIENKDFLIMSDKGSRKFERISRWFPNYMRKQKLEYTTSNRS